MDRGILASSPPNTRAWKSIQNLSKPVTFPATNPCIDRTSICFDILKADHVNVSIYNVRGQLVRRAIADDYYDGRHQVSWDGQTRMGRHAQTIILIN
jgi:flagellar hook assembly protein FlgD